MTNLLLKQEPQSFVLQPQQSHPRLSLERVLYTKFLRWVDQASTDSLRKLLVRSGIVLLLVAGVLAPQFTLGMLTAAAKWNGYRIPLFLCLLALTLNARRIWRLVRRHRVQTKGANQHTYRGLPVDELASYLFEHRSFKRDDAMSRFGITQPKQVTIANELEHHQVLVRGENNARVLNDKLTREQLVRQLRDDFPLAFSDGEWVERQGSYHLFLRDKERSEQKERERVERLERRVGRATAILKQSAELRRAEGFHTALIAA